MQLQTAAHWLLTFPARASLADNNQQTYDKPLARSEPSYPSPWMNPDAEGWAEAYAQAKAFVSQLTLLEKVNLTTGVG